MSFKRYGIGIVQCFLLAYALPLSTSQTVQCSSTTNSVNVTSFPKARIVGKQENCIPRCEIKIPKQHGISQIRVDFLAFDVGVANYDGLCDVDSITFTGASNLPNGLTLCGTAAGQHLYLHYADDELITIKARLETEGANYEFEITMIECGTTDVVPPQCTQHFKESTGVVQSFNYPNQQLSNQNYTICTGSSIGSYIIWRPCTTTPSSFFISGDPWFPPGASKSCSLDFIRFAPSLTKCGSDFGEEVISQEFQLDVHFNEYEDPPIPVLNPETGCPLGFSCDGPNWPCLAGDYCTAPAFYGGNLDSGNIGFCLRYTI